jgi:hypothetical protein
MIRREHPAEEWAQDIEARQRNVVFPDTVQNEARFWRNLGNQPWTPVTRVGLALFGLFVFGLLGRFVVALFQVGVAPTLRLMAVMLLIWGPIFFAIAWATRRALRNISHSKRKR